MVNGGVITIREETQRDPALGASVVLRLSDTGPGIPESVRDKVFQPFFSTKEEGTGLGLSIATRIIEDHGGRIELGPRENGGATFIITLPLKESEHGPNPDS
jgi:signal transduction histidine kinase